MLRRLQNHQKFIEKERKKLEARNLFTQKKVSGSSMIYRLKIIAKMLLAVLNSNLSQRAHIIGKFRLCFMLIAIIYQNTRKRIANEIFYIYIIYYEYAVGTLETRIMFFSSLSTKLRLECLTLITISFNF